MPNPILATPDSRMADLRSNRPSDATANAIKDIGNLVLGADAQLAEARLTRDLTSETAAYTNAKDTGTAGPQSIMQDTDYRDIGGMSVDVLKNPQYAKSMEQYKSKLDANLDAHTQGKISTLNFQARVEDITRKAIAARPGLRRELTAAAASTLGFDPTGSQLRSLMAEARTEAGALKGFEKGVQNTQEKLGEYYEKVRLQFPTASREDNLQRASIIMENEQRKETLLTKVSIAINQASMSESEMAVLEDDHNKLIQIEQSNLIHMSDVTNVGSQEEWDGKIGSVEQQTAQIRTNLEDNLKKRKDWQENPALRKTMLEKFAKAREADKVFFAASSRMYKDAKDAESGELNRELLRQRLGALSFFRQQFGDSNPALYQAVIMTNGGVLSTMLGSSAFVTDQMIQEASKLMLPGGPKPMGVNTFAPNRKGSTKAKPVSANIPAEVESSATAIRFTKDYDTLKTDKDKQSYGAGGGFVFDKLFNTDPLKGNEQSHSDSMIGYLGDLSRAYGDGRGAVSLGNNGTVRQFPVSDSSPNNTTDAEAAQLKIAASIINNPERALQTPELTRALTTNTAPQMRGYAIQLLDLGSSSEVSKYGRLEVKEVGGVPQLALVPKNTESAAEMRRTGLAAYTLINRFNLVSSSLYAIDPGYKERINGLANSIVWE